MAIGIKITFSQIRSRMNVLNVEWKKQIVLGPDLNHINHWTTRSQSVHELFVVNIK